MVYINNYIQVYLLHNCRPEIPMYQDIYMSYGIHIYNIRGVFYYKSLTSPSFEYLGNEHFHVE